MQQGLCVNESVLLQRRDWNIGLKVLQGGAEKKICRNVLKGEGGNF